MKFQFIARGQVDRTSFAGWCALGAVLLAATGCGSTPPANPGGEVVNASAPVTEVPGGRIYAKLLHSVNPEPDHAVEFYEFKPGDYLMRETQSVDSKKPLLLDQAGKNATLVDVFRLAVPGATEADVPDVLRQADKLAAVAMSKKTAVVARAPVSGSADGVGTVAQAIGDDGSDPVIVPDPEQPCSADEFGDDWGAQWFLNNFCDALNFRECDTNGRFFSSGEETTQNFIAKQMEGDFVNRGHTHGRNRTSQECEGPWYDPVCTDYYWETSWDFDIQPRQTSAMQTTGGYPSAQRAAWGWSECGHGHHAWLFN
jgi:hypothetical protein